VNQQCSYTILLKIIIINAPACICFFHLFVSLNFDLFNCYTVTADCLIKLMLFNLFDVSATVTMAHYDFMYSSSLN